MFSARRGTEEQDSSCLESDNFSVLYLPWYPQSLWNKVKPERTQNHQEASSHGCSCSQKQGVEKGALMDKRGSIALGESNVTKSARRGIMGRAASIGPLLDVFC